MTSETKSEIVIVTALAAFLAFLWWHNRGTGAGSGIPSIFAPSFSGGGNPGSDVNNLFPPATYNITNGGIDVGGSTYGGLNVGGSTYGGSTYGGLNTYAQPGVPGGCSSCPGETGMPNFGAPADLNAWLASNPAILQAAASALNGNWN